MIILAAGYYFITICVKDKREILGHVVGTTTLGRPAVELSETGLMVEKHIEGISTVYKDISIDKYVVMPNHIHFIAVLKNGTPGCASPTKNGFIAGFTH